MRRVGRYILNGLTVLSAVLVLVVLGALIWASTTPISTQRLTRGPGAGRGDPRPYWYALNFGVSRGRVYLNWWDITPPVPRRKRAYSYLDAEMFTWSEGWRTLDYDALPQAATAPSIRDDSSFAGVVWNKWGIIVPVPYLLIPPGLFLAVRAGRWWRRRRVRRPSDGLCPACGYDLRASPARCPECGLARSADDGTADARG